MGARVLFCSALTEALQAGGLGSAPGAGTHPYPTHGWLPVSSGLLGALGTLPGPACPESPLSVAE